MHLIWHRQIAPPEQIAIALMAYFVGIIKFGRARSNAVGAMEKDGLTRNKTLYAMINIAASEDGVMARG